VAATVVWNDLYSEQRLHLGTLFKIFLKKTLNWSVWTYWSRSKSQCYQYTCTYM